MQVLLSSSLGWNVNRVIESDRAVPEPLNETAKTGNECSVLFLIHFNQVLTATITQLINRLSLVFSRQNLKSPQCRRVGASKGISYSFVCFAFLLIQFAITKIKTPFCAGQSIFPYSASAAVFTTSCDWFTIIPRVCCNWSERNY